MRIFLLLIIPFVTIAQEEWRLDKNKQGIKVFTRKIEGFKIRQFRVEAMTSASLKDIEALFSDVDSYPAWMPDIQAAEVVRKINEHTLIYKLEINSPFPVTDRELIAEMQITRPSPNVLLIEYVNKPDELPENKGFIRLAAFEGFWKFTRTGNNTSIENKFLSDPAGSVPDWMVNSFISRNPYEMVTNLKKYVE